MSSGNVSKYAMNQRCLREGTELTGDWIKKDRKTYTQVITITKLAITLFITLFQVLYWKYISLILVFNLHNNTWNKTLLSASTSMLSRTCLVVMWGFLSTHIFYWHFLELPEDVHGLKQCGNILISLPNSYKKVPPCNEKTSLPWHRLKATIPFGHEEPHPCLVFHMCEQLHSSKSWKLILMEVLVHFWSIKDM